ncbi:unnamed protein product [Peniophora sp. CBMAI 1063]|nr:unnamed protein product [Peniophora sp. CBMAI 1063]
MSSDKQKLSVSLQLLSKTCTALLNGLVSPTPPDQPLPLTSLHSDLLSLLALLANDANKLVLVVYPPGMQPSFKAALAPLRDLTTHTSTLASNAASFAPATHGKALTSEVRDLTREVIQAIQELAVALIVFVDAPLRTTRDGKGKGEAHMVKVAAIHALIDSARSSVNGVSSSNAQAVRKMWRERGLLVRDALEELEDSGLPAGNDEEEEEEDEFDFGGPVSAEERAFKAQLHAFVKRLLLTYEEVGAALFSLPAPDAAFDPLLDASSAITRAVDELAACAYDGPEELPARKKVIVKALKGIGKALDGIWEKSKATRDDEQAKDKEEDEKVIKGSGPWFAAELIELIKAVVAVQWPADLPK